MTAKKHKPTRQSRHDFKAVSVAFKTGRDDDTLSHVQDRAREEKIGASSYLRKLAEMDRRKRAK